MYWTPSRSLDDSSLVPVPETTSAEAFARYVGGKVLRVGRGKAWREIQAWTMALPRVMDLLPLPSVSEPFLAWTMSGEVEFQEREGNRPWITHRLRKGSFFLTSGGAPHECRWRWTAGRRAPKLTNKTGRVFENFWRVSASIYAFVNETMKSMTLRETQAAGPPIQAAD